MYARLFSILIAGAVCCVAATGQVDYTFDTTISREVLENYLARSLNLSFIYAREDEWPDAVRMVESVGAKHLGRTIGKWGSQGIGETFFSQGSKLAQTFHAADPDIVLQAAIYEIVTIDANDIAIPEWVLTEFGQPATPRNFSYENMLSREGRFIDLWGKNASVPDISRPETQMWYFYLAASYIDAGFESLHFGQLKLITACDPGYKETGKLLARIRRYAARHARRHMVMCDSHVSSGIDCFGLGNDAPDDLLGAAIDGQLLFDFHALPLRIKEITSRPYEAELEVGHVDAIYKRSMGGTSPSGWECDHLPYLVEFDNWGNSGMPGQSVLGKVDHPAGVNAIFWVWGYDEISWFAHQTEVQRNAWLHYAWDWVRNTDPNGFVQMPGRRGFTNPIDGNSTYYANTRSDSCPYGFNQEETIKSIWAEAKRP